MVKIKLTKICYILLLIIGMILIAGCNSDNSDDSLSDSKNNNLREICGKIIDATMNTLTIEESSGNIYQFTKDSEVLEVNEDGIKIGLLATIKYYGELDSYKKVQEVKVVKIIIVPENKDDMASKVLNKMTLEEKVGQMFYVRCPGETAIEMIQKYSLGGYILFAKDFEEKSKEEVIGNIKSYQDISNTKMLIGVDEEGGTVNRVSSYKQFRNTPFLAPKDIYNIGGWDLIASDTTEKIELLKSLGINVNMAPVCDITTDINAFMYERAFSNDERLTTKYVKSVVNMMNKNKIGSVLKHFPGYGDNLDTHTGIAFDDRDYSQFDNIDFKPFIAGIEEGADCVLVSHNIVSSMDKEKPASLSKPVHDILRNKLRFNGVIMTDDLLMDAIKDYTDDESAAVMAVKAGNDLICTTDFETQIPAVIEAVKNGSISEDQINESVMRILNWKIELGIIK